MEKFDLLVKNGLLIDPANNKMGRFDIGLADGRVAAVDADLPSEWAQEIYDAASKLVLPGLVDVHVHLTPHIWATGFQMLARTGVTCGLECTGWVNDVVAAMEQGGSGISVAALNRLDPGVTISGSDAKKKELAEYLDRSLDDGAFGFKLLGGHLPLSPETISAAIELANAAKVYVACHCGSTRNGSNLYGLQDTMEFAGDNRILICHTNAYCRGLTHGSPATESLIALKELAAHRNVISDSNMGPYNYCEARFDGEIIRDQVTQTWLKAGGFEPNREGLLAAAKTGYMRVVTNTVQGAAYLDPEAGVTRMNEVDFDAWVSFPVNRRPSAFLMATEKDEDGRFIVNALATDGGGIPRNVLLSHGLSLVKFDALTLSEFVQKCAWMPAQMLGLPRKGHLGDGADGDLVVVDPDTHKALLTVARGKIIMIHGVVVGSGGIVITTERGKKSLEGKGIPCEVADLSGSLLYTGSA